MSMPPPMQLPVRILFKGPSTLMWTSMMGGPRSDMAFPRVVEQQLLARGRACDVWNAAELGWPTRFLFKTWDAEVAAWQPDVLVLAVGHYETLHAILPRWLERLANTEHRRPGFHKWKRLFFRAVARVVLLTQKKVDGPWLKCTRRLNRSKAEVQGYIDMTSRVSSPLILLMELHEPTQVKQQWFRGWVPRARVINSHLRELAEKNADKNVRFLPISDLMDQFDPPTAEALWADGIHFSSRFHRAIGDKITEIVDEWAAGESHLVHP